MERHASICHPGQPGVPQIVASPASWACQPRNRWHVRAASNVQARRRTACFSSPGCVKCWAKVADGIRVMCASAPTCLGPIRVRLLTRTIVRIRPVVLIQMHRLADRLTQARATSWLCVRTHARTTSRHGGRRSAPFGLTFVTATPTEDVGRSAWQPWSRQCNT